MELDSPDGDQGFPGAVHVAVTYEVAGDEVHIRYASTTDRPTVVNMTNHSYFNLEGEDAGSVDRHLLTVEADYFTPSGADRIPTGEQLSVEHTPFDWREPTLLGPGDLDQNFVVRGTGLRRAATLTAPATGLLLTAFSDQPGIQVYNGSFADGSFAGGQERRDRPGNPALSRLTQSAVLPVDGPTAGRGAALDNGLALREDAVARAMNAVASAAKVSFRVCSRARDGSQRTPVPARNSRQERGLPHGGGGGIWTRNSAFCDLRRCAESLQFQ